jgi:tetratricopeptide (TPR) repeat protein
VPPPKGRGASWGGLARRAAGAGGTAAPSEPAPKGRLAAAGPSKAAEAFGAAGGRTRRQQEQDDERGAVVEVRRELVEGDPVRRAAGKAVSRGRTAVPEASGQPASRTRKAPAGLTAELTPAVGATSAPRFAVRLADAGRAFAADRFPEAKRILGPMARQAPTSAAVRELHGLTLYRLGKYLEAAKELEAFRELTGSTEQHPVLADCYRALGRYDEVEALWLELREVSPTAELVAEGRIVYAGSLADRGDLAGAIAEIEPATKRIKRPQDHHLRLLYVLGDLHERVGDAPRARALFDRVLAVDPDFGDTAARRRQLS